MNFHIDRLSFLLGFILASLGWFLLSRVRSAWPKWKTYADQKISELRERNLSGLENYLRQETIERAQRQHLSARMFSLEEILVEPRLLAAPATGEPDLQPGQEPVIAQLISYLPDQPLLPSQYGYPSLSMEEALLNGAPITIIGRPGAGKSVALAHFAIQAARRQCSVPIANLVPIYLHVQEVDFRSTKPEDLTAALQRAVTRRMLVLYQNQVGIFLQSALAGGRTLLIVDGVDELAPQQLAEASAWLKSLRATYPGTRIVTTGDPSYLDGLLSAGFLPLTLAPWRPDDAHGFVHRWKEAWDRVISPQIASANGRKPVDSSLLENWLIHRSVHLTPLEWTLQTWALFAGDATGPQPAQAIESYVRRLLQDQADLEPLSHLAAHLIHSGQGAVPMVEANLIIGEIIGAATAPYPAEGVDQRDTPARKDGEKTRPISAGTKILDVLTVSGLLVKHPGDRIAFSQPVICGFLASRSANLESLQETAATGVFCWSIQSACLRYLLGQGKVIDLVDHLIAEDTPPLHSNLAWLCSFLSDSAPQIPWRASVMRALVHAIQDENLPFATRARLVSALSGTNDPSIGVLFRQLLGSPTPDVRRLAALAAGALQDGKAMEDLITRLSDPDPLVQFSACLGLSNLPSSQAQEAVMAAMSDGNEDLRLVAAESLAAAGPDGYRVLLEALKSPDVVLRRVAVLGLATIREPWVHGVLEKTAIEDGQWIVRNSATQAIESFNGPKAHLPRGLPPPSEASWLIKFASRFGGSVSREQSPIPILLQALQEGSPQEQKAAMEYLRRSTDASVIEKLYEEAEQPSAVTDAALYALWWMNVSGVQLPAAVEHR